MLSALADASRLERIAVLAVGRFAANLARAFVASGLARVAVRNSVCMSPMHWRRILQLVKYAMETYLPVVKACSPQQRHR